MSMGIEFDIMVLLVIQTIATQLFALFEIETPALRKIVKWLLVDTITITLCYWLGHYGLIFFGLIILLGTVVHIRLTTKNGIDPLRATPRKKYYKMRGWKWPEY